MSSSVSATATRDPSKSISPVIRPRRHDHVAGMQIGVTEDLWLVLAETGGCAAHPFGQERVHVVEDTAAASGLATFAAATSSRNVPGGAW